MDLFYLEDQDLARQLVELGYRGSGETLKVNLVLPPLLDLAPHMNESHRGSSLQRPGPYENLMPVPSWTESATMYSCSQREEFDARKKAAEEAKASKLRNAPKKLASADKDLSHFPFLHNLAEREVLLLEKGKRVRERVRVRERARERERDPTSGMVWHQKWLGITRFIMLHRLSISHGPDVTLLFPLYFFISASLAST